MKNAKAIIFNSKDKKSIMCYGRRIYNPFNAETIIVDKKYIIYENCEKELPFSDEYEKE